MNGKNQILIFYLDEKQYGLPVDSVVKIIPVVEITPVPDVPAVILGVIDYHGEIIPVYNIRKRLDLTVKEIDITDYIIIASTKTQKLGILVDRTGDIIEAGESDFSKTKDHLYTFNPAKGILKSKTGIVLIQDIDKFITSAEEQALQKSIKSIRK